MKITKGMRVCMKWDRKHRGTIKEVGEEVSGMMLDESPDKLIRYYPNNQFRPLIKKDGKEL